MEMDAGNTTVNCYNETVNQHEGDTVCGPESVYKHTCFIVSKHLIHLCEMLLTTENVHCRLLQKNHKNTFSDILKV